jgi:hypothetical protein
VHIVHAQSGMAAQVLEEGALRFAVERKHFYRQRVLAAEAVGHF